MQQVKVLAFVFVQTFDLHVENRIRADFDAGLGFDFGSQGDFVGVLDGHEAVLENWIVRVVGQQIELVELFGPVTFNLFINQVGQARVTGFKPATRGDAVGDVDEFVRPQFGKVREQFGFDQLGVDLCHTIDLERSDYTQVGHAYHAGRMLFNQRQCSTLGHVARPAFFDFFIEEVFVDLIQQLQVAR